MQLTIAFADERDAALLASLITTAFEEYRATLVPPSSAHRETADSLRAVMTGPGGGALIALDGAVRVGCVVFHDEEEDLYFGRLSVLPGARGKGVAKALIGAVEEYAAAAGYPGTRLGVRLALPANGALFASLGYEVTSHGTHEGFTRPTWANMRKAIASSRGGVPRV